MSPRQPVVSGERLIKALRKDGWEVVRQRGTLAALAGQVFPLTDVKAYMAHADIATTMIYIHRVPQVDAAEKLSAALKAASTATFEPVRAAA